MRRILHAFSTFELGGPQARFIRLGKHFGKQYQHSVIAMDGRYGAEFTLRNEDWYRRIDMPVIKGRNLNNIPLMRKTLKEFRPDVLFTYNFGAFEWAFATTLTPTKHFHVEEGFGPQEAEKRLWRRSMMRKLGFIVSPVKLVVISETMRSIAKMEWGVAEARSNAVVNGVDTHLFSESSRNLRSRGDLLTIGTVAALRPEKRLDRLLLVVKKISNSIKVQCKIAGAGSEEVSLKRLAVDLGISELIQFVGHLDETRDFYQGLDLFILTSDTEQVPLSLLEAMSCGLPAVATNVGDISRILGNSNARVVCDREVDDIANSVLNLSSNPDIMVAMGQSNRKKIIQSYSAEQMYSQWRNLFEA